MSYTIEQGKENGLVQANVIPKPLLLISIQAVDGDAVYLTTTPSLGGTTQAYGGHVYQARLASNIIEQIQAQSPQGYDIPGSVNLVIDDGDFVIWNSHANAHGWRGGTLTVLFVLWDIPSNTYSTNAYTWVFILDKPQIDDSGVLKVAAQARQSMTRLNVPNVPRQNRCSHTFPSTAAQRLDGLQNPTSQYWSCGYSPDQGGPGNTTTPNLTNPDGSPLTDSAGLYVVCDYTRSCGAGKATLTQGCMARLGHYAGTLAPDGDIEHDSSGNYTARFDGDTWLAPVGYAGRQYTNPSAGKIYGFNAPNPPTGTTYYTQGYGVQWVDALVLEPVSDPNSYRAEAVVCVAEVNPANILKVLVNGVEITRNNSDVLFTYYVRSAGGRSGAVNPDSSFYQNQGDPHGSLCYIEFVVPAELQASGSIASVQVLVQFPQPLHVLPIASASASGGNITLTLAAGVSNIDCLAGQTVYVVGNTLTGNGPGLVGSATTGPPGTIVLAGTTATGTGTGGAVYYYPNNIVVPNIPTDVHNFADAAMVDAAGNASANPVWALMDLLCWGPFTVLDFDAQTWWDAAQICAQQINYLDINGNSATHARYRCSLALTTGTRGSLAKAVLGVRNCAGIILARNPINGLLQCYIEQTLADQQPVTIVGSNYNTAVASLHADGTAGTGHLAYLFDGAGSIEKGTFKMGGRTLNDTPNTVSFPFQDSANVWVKDSITDIDPNGYVTSGNQEIQDQFQVFGIENFDQGIRRGNVQLATALYCNTRFDAGGSELPSFRTTVKAAHLAGRVGYICGITYQQLGL